MFGDVAFVDTGLFAYVVLPFLIFLSRIMDVSIGTIRVIFVARGMRYVAPILGFFEVLIWLVAIGQIMQNLTSPLYYVAYAGGFAAGTFVGIWIESKLAIGVVSLRIITRADATELIRVMREGNFGVTILDAEGATGPVKIIFMLLWRQDLPRAISLVKTYNPQAFYSVEDIRFVREGIFPDHRNRFQLRVPRIPRHIYRRLSKKK